MESELRHECPSCCYSNSLPLTCTHIDSLRQHSRGVCKTGLIVPRTSPSPSVSIPNLCTGAAHILCSEKGLTVSWCHQGAGLEMQS